MPNFIFRYFCSMNKTKSWLHALRLRTLPLSIAGILMGSAIALILDKWNSWIFAFSLITTVLFQILSNLANDLGDTIKGTDNDNRVGPSRAVQSGAITRKEMTNAIILTTVLSLVSAGMLIYFSLPGMSTNTLIIYIVLAFLSVAAAITYTIGKKAYGYHGLGDLMVLIFFGFVSVIGVFVLYSKFFEKELILPSLTIGLLSMAVLNLNNMRDFKNDAANHKNTLVVRMGATRAKFYHALLILLALLSLVVFIHELNIPELYISFLPGILLVLHLRKVMRTSDPKDFDPELKVVALSTFFIALIFLGTSIYLSWPI